MLPIEYLDVFAAGIYLLFGVIHFDLWRKRRDRASHLWLAAASGGALLVDLTGMKLRGTGVAGGALPFLNLLGVALVTASLFELVISLGNGRSSMAMRAVYAFMGVLIPVVAIGKVQPLFSIFYLTSMVVLLWAMVHALRAGQAGDPESRTIAAGLIILILCLVVDLLGNLRVIGQVPGLPILGFTALFVVSASALNTRYEREHRELVALRGDLEQRVSDRTRELEVANQRLAEASRTDALTSLPNRRGFLEMSELELKRCARNAEACSVVMIDLDHFKEINDEHGHAAGDLLLQSAAERLRSMLRDADLVARWGGEEFILLLPDTRRDGAVAVAEKIRGAFEHGEKVTASFGVAEHGPNMSREATIAAADEALYRAKREGRNRVVG